MKEAYDYDVTKKDENERIILVFKPEINGECWTIKQKYSAGTYVLYADKTGYEKEVVMEEFDRTFDAVESNFVNNMEPSNLIDYCQRNNDFWK